MAEDSVTGESSLLVTKEERSDIMYDMEDLSLMLLLLWPLQSRRHREKLLLRLLTRPGRTVHVQVTLGVL